MAALPLPSAVARQWPLDVPPAAGLTAEVSPHLRQGEKDVDQAAVGVGVMPDPKHAQARGRRGGGVEGQSRPIIGTTADQRGGERQESDENQE